MFKKILDFLMPPKEWRIPVFSVLIITGVLLIQIFVVSRAYSYLSDDPTACTNCHVMVPEYTSWSHSSHGAVTSCNDCHVPHSNVVSKYLYKATDGLRHAFMFTLRLEPSNIMATKGAREVIQSNCTRCHNPLIKTVSVGQVKVHGEGQFCFDCHRDVPHGRTRSFSNSIINPNVEKETPRGFNFEGGKK